MASPSVLTLEDINIIELKTLKAVFNGFEDVLRDKGVRISRVFPKVVSFSLLPSCSGRIDLRSRPSRRAHCFACTGVPYNPSLQCPIAKTTRYLRAEKYVVV
jgi:hypothetical protein